MSFQHLLIDARYSSFPNSHQLQCTAILGLRVLRKQYMGIKLVKRQEFVLNPLLK